MRVFDSMRPSWPLAAAFSALLTTGCGIPSFGPEFIPQLTALGVIIQSPSYSALYDDDAMLAEPLLLGEWVEVGDQATWRFEETDDAGYRLTISTSAAPAVMQANVVQLGAHRFVDLQFVDPTTTPSDEPLFELHAIFKLVLRNDRVKLAGLSQTWLRETLENGERTVGHESLESGMIILNAPTTGLRAFVLQASADPEAFPDPAAGGAGFDLLRRTRR